MRLARWFNIELLLLCVFLTSCGGRIYRPDPTITSKIGITKAREAFLLSDSKLQPTNQVGVQLARDGTAMKIKYRDGSSCVAYFRDIAKNVDFSYTIGIYKYSDLIRVEGVPCGKYPNHAFNFLTMHDAQMFVDAIYVLVNAPLSQLRIPEDPAEQASFEKAAKQYRSKSVKPVLPEDAWKYKVQADTAVAKKQYDDAIELYENALKIAPWWPEGHFNRALLMGNAQDYFGAVQEMKRYLALAPDAPDARKAQDQIYQWKARCDDGQQKIFTHHYEWYSSIQIKLDVIFL